MPQQAKKKNKTAQNNCSYTFSIVNACMYNCRLRRMGHRTAQDRMLPKRLVAMPEN